MNVEFSVADPLHVDEDLDPFFSLMLWIRIRTRLFILMQIRIRLLTLIRFRIWILPLMKVMQITYHWSTGPPPTLFRASFVIIYGPARFLLELPQLLILTLDADPDPLFSVSCKIL
jgi:hypothetical protein